MLIIISFSNLTPDESINPFCYAVFHQIVLCTGYMNWEWQICNSVGALLVYKNHSQSHSYSRFYSLAYSPCGNLECAFCICFGKLKDTTIYTVYFITLFACLCVGVHVCVCGSVRTHVELCLDYFRAGSECWLLHTFRGKCAKKLKTPNKSFPQAVTLCVRVCACYCLCLVLISATGKMAKGSWVKSRAGRA